LNGARPACDEAKIDVLVLFYLEQRMGRWAVQSFSEYDIVHETFNPYVNRHLHCLMLGVEKSRRLDRRWDVSLEQINYMWPDVLQEPINPQNALGAKVQQFIRRYIVHKAIPPSLPIYQLLRFWKRKRRFHRQHRGSTPGIAV
jgi:hypothetical protein